ncbi:MAG: hypothetical protein R6V01_06680 [Thermoplasmatota archaeon]
MSEQFIVTAVVRSIEPLGVTIIWEFDHNGMFHIIQTIGMLVLASGKRAGLEIMEEMEDLK